MGDRPRVLIDCTAIPAKRGGVGRYIEGLLRGLRTEDVDLVLAVQQRDRDTLSALVPWAEVHSLNRFWSSRFTRMLWEQLVLPFLALKLAVEVIHSPHYTFPLFWLRPRVVTLHDATFFSDPMVHYRTKRWFFRGWTRRSWRLATEVVTPSRATAFELDRFLGPTPARIFVAILGVDHTRFYPPAPTGIDDLVTHLGIDLTNGWFVFLGTIEPRKNLGSLLDAYKILRDEHGPNTPQLLISGARGWDSVAIAELDNLGPDSGVHELGYVPIEHLPALLGGAVAVVYPSLGEGFGLPVLEAMACGAAVITTRRLAIPEVGGDAVIYTGVDAPSIKQHMHALLLNESTRKRLSSLALARAAEFTWRSTAQAHVKAYRTAAGTRR